MFDRTVFFTWWFAECLRHSACSLHGGTIGKLPKVESMQVARPSRKRSFRHFLLAECLSYLRKDFAFSLGIQLATAL